MKCLLVLMMLVIAIGMCGSLDAANPFFAKWKTPFGVPPFGEIELEHYQPAFEEAMKQHNQEISAIYKKRSLPHSKTPSLPWIAAVPCSIASVPSSLPCDRR